MRIVLTGGGTGGHLVPFEPIIEAVRLLYLEQKSTLPKRLDPDELELRFLGVADKETHEFFNHYDVASTNIPAGKIRRYMSHLNLIDMAIKLPIGIIKALAMMWHIMPDVVISKGGYGSFPVVLAAGFYRVPVLLHESDISPGLANRRLARYASAIAVGFTDAKDKFGKFNYKTVITGTPVRSQFIPTEQTAAKKIFELPPEEPVLLVMGGSLGAQEINELLLSILPQLITETSIIHITGKSHYEAVSTVAEELIANSPRRELYKPYSYLTDTIDEALSAADAVVARSGATTLAELARLGKPSLLIPLGSSANDHQRKNADFLERVGAARVLDPNNLGKNLFLQNVRDLITDENLRRQMAENVKRLDYPQASRDIASLAFKLSLGFAPSQT